MSRQANGVIQLQFLGNLLNVLSPAVGDQVQAPWGVAQPAVSLDTGVEDDQINRSVSKRSITLNSGDELVVDVFDFAGFDQGSGDGVDLVGQSMALDAVVGILVVVAAGSTGKLKVGGEGSTAAFNSIFDGSDSAKVVIGATALNPGMFLIFTPAVDAYAVEDVANHLLKFAADGGAVDFAFFLIGRDNP